MFANSGFPIPGVEEAPIENTFVRWVNTCSRPSGDQKAQGRRMAAGKLSKAEVS